MKYLQTIDHLVEKGSSDQNRFKVCMLIEKYNIYIKDDWPLISTLELRVE